MRLLTAIIAGLLLAAAPARAVTSEAVSLDAGPGAKERHMAPVWMMRCPGIERLVGIRVANDGRVAGVRAICARVRLDDQGVRWLSAPSLLPEPPPVVEMVTRVRQVVEGEGTILRADSNGVTRQRGSRALIITIKQPVKREARAEKGMASAVDAPVRVEFRNVAKAEDVVCPADHVVVGLRTGSETGARTTRLAAIQLLCGDGLGRVLEPVGAWPDPAAPQRSKKRKRKQAPPLAIQRIECGVSDANPHDGLAAQAIFGTADAGRVTTIGLSCSGRLDSLRTHSRLYAAMRGTAVRTLRAMGWATRIQAPKWLDGAEVAICARGKRTKACVQDSADRYCADVAGYERASSYAIGRYVQDAVVPGAGRCERGTCRAFASITCLL